MNLSLKTYVCVALAIAALPASAEENSAEVPEIVTSLIAAPASLMTIGIVRSDALMQKLAADSAPDKELTGVARYSQKSGAIELQLSDGKVANMDIFKQNCEGVLGKIQMAGRVLPPDLGGGYLFKDTRPFSLYAEYFVNVGTDLKGNVELLQMIDGAIDVLYYASIDEKNYWCRSGLMDSSYTIEGGS